MTIQTHFIDEPLLEFGSCQKLEHRQDGLFLYGPVASQGSPGVIHVGIVGTADGIQLVTKWLEILMRRLPVERPEQLHSSPWPGFQAAFGIRLETKPLVTIPLSSNDISYAIPTATTPFGPPFSSSRTQFLSIFAPTTGGPTFGSRSCLKSFIGTDDRKSVVRKIPRHPH